MKISKNLRLALFILPVFFQQPVNSQPATGAWWMTEPISLIQTNLRETDSGLDGAQLVREVKAFPANTILFSVGGITAHYPTDVPFHFRSDYLPEGKDLVGEVLDEAHRSEIRIIGRFDFSRARKAVYDAHPEWFYAQKDGSPVVDDNDLYSVCINGGYYNEKALEILAEALGRYDLDGLFFNWFGNITSDYKGNYIGLCHCGVCESGFRARFGRSIPDRSDRDYDAFMFDSKMAVAKKIRDLIREKRPKALFMTYIDDYTDGIVTEADFYKWRALPQWIYTASEHVNRGLNSHPDKMPFSLVMPYQEMRYRFATISGDGIRALLYQNMAQGAFPTFVNLGGMEQPDRTAMDAARPVFRFYQAHQADYLGQRSAARVILYARQDLSWREGAPAYRGFYRLLTELHVPFKVTNRVTEIDPKDIDMVVIPEGPTPPELDAYIQKGGAVLIAGTTHPGLELSPPAKLWEGVKSAYFRIQDHTAFPSLQSADVVFLEGDYLETGPIPTPVTLIPPGQFGPPDKVAVLNEVTDKPGLILKDLGKGHVAWIPWDIGGLYYLYSNNKHRLFVSDLIRYLVPEDHLQLTTNAHSSVEITVMRHPDPDRVNLHLVNLSGHAGTGFSEAIEMRDISIRIRGEFSKAVSLVDGQSYPVTVSDGYSAFSIPELEEYIVVVLTIGL
ncbi:MAG: hypothetical protein H6562_20625 [Lewinellaceae bacterium]|nr:hypothetical protein [Lewinellaceae bacterium]